MMKRPQLRSTSLRFRIFCDTMITILQKTVARNVSLALLTVALLLACVCLPLSAKDFAFEPRKGKDLVAEIPQRAVDEDGVLLSVKDVGITVFVGSDGRPGYFRQSLAVYERDGEACRESGHAIRRRIIGQRASYYCPACQR